MAEDRSRVPACQQCTTENQVPTTRGSEVPVREVLHRYLREGGYQSYGLSVLLRCAMHNSTIRYAS